MNRWQRLWAFAFTLVLAIVFVLDSPVVYWFEASPNIPYPHPFTIEAAICSPRSGYSFCAVLTQVHTQNGGTDSANFPVGVIGTANGTGTGAFSSSTVDLRTVGNGGKIQHTASSTPSPGVTCPADLVLTSDSVGSTLLTYECASYTASTGAIELYVNLSISHTSDTLFYISFGNAAVSTYQGGNAWNAAFIAVIHANNVILTSGKVTTAVDSTGQQNGGGAISGASSTLTQVAGIAGSALSSPDSNGHVALQAVDSVGFPTGASTRSLEIWFTHSGNFSNSGGVENAVGWGTKNTMNFWGIGGCTAAGCGVGSQSILFPLYFGNGVVKAFTVDSAFHYAAATYPTGQTRADQAVSYLSGAVQTTTTLTPASTVNTILTGGNLCIGGGAACDGSTIWVGVIDEVRISNVQRSADWLLATFNNLNTPGSFVTASNAVTGGGNMPPAIF